MCGELYWEAGRWCALSGSSPRVWGTPRNGHLQAGLRRFIPACVGNSGTSGLGLLTEPVHPRVCGELEPSQYPSSGGYGSSPRVWGTRVLKRHNHTLPRFIPACVGNSPPIPSQIGGYPVHPRVCGELTLICKNAIGEYGSSPRVWGTHPVSGWGWWFSRFIPACVGNSLSTVVNDLASPVHPRVCGELSVPPLPLGMSSVHPRVCGELISCFCLFLRGRFIPACVGNSQVRVTVISGVPVHPRVCGELAHGGFPEMRSGSVHPRVCGELSATRQ